MKKIISLIILIAGVILLAGTAQELKAQSMVVIVNKDNPTANMKQIEVKLYYLRKIKKAWPESGASIQPVGMSSDSEAKNTFLQSILKMSESEVAAYFKQRQFANAEAVPPTFAREADVIKYVSENVGAIGYVSRAAFASSGGQVKSVLTQ